MVSVILIMTPFHEDDLAGRLQRIQGDEWKVLRLPAICDDAETDPLGRQIGEPLWSDDQYGYGQRLLELQAAAEREGRARDWFAQYQGRPRPPEGAMFKPARMPVIEPKCFRGSSKRCGPGISPAVQKGIGPLGLLMGRSYDSTPRAGLSSLDIVRFRGPPEEVRAAVRTVAAADGYSTKIWIPLDPAQAGADQADSYIRMLSGYRIEAERMSGDKATRADAAASQANIGRLGMVRAAWNAAFIEELASFPARGPR